MQPGDRPGAGGADPPTIGAFGALSIGIGGIVGGGFFATFGITIAGAGGATPLACLIAGLIALATAYSYIGLSLRYPGPGGTVGFVTRAFGSGALAASVNVLLVLSYVCIMAVYARALASYAAAYLPAEDRAAGQALIASGAILLLGGVNLAGGSLMGRLEGLFNIGKLAALGLFVAAGLLVGGLAWERLSPADWVAPSTIVASGILGFLAYEGFELIANASHRIASPRRNLPIAFLGSVLIAMVIYGLAFVVAIGHLDIEAILDSRAFAVSAAARSFLGEPGFALMALGAILASASAINADFFGASRLPPELATDRELPSAFARGVHGRETPSILAVGGLALAGVNLVSLDALSAATSGGFLLVFAAVNLAAFRLAGETGANRALVLVAMALCLLALVVMVAEFLGAPATRGQAFAVLAIVLMAGGVELVSRLLQKRAG